ncbi:MAG TPA: TetR/AcrR family transcriptional regulator [Acidimicrobiales bacterium]
MSWVERAADRSPTVQRSRSKSIKQAQQIVAAARRLIGEQGTRFTTQELVKEAGVAIQTFYRCFGGKDQLMLAVLEDMIAEGARGYEEAARDLDDPVERLRLYLRLVLRTVAQKPGPNVQLVPGEHWRLYQLYPEEVTQATRPIVDLVQREIEAARDRGQLDPTDPERDAWLITRLIMAEFHHYAFSEMDDPEAVLDHIWAFCLGALGGRRAGQPETGQPDA